MVSYVLFKVVKNKKKILLFSLNIPYFSKKGLRRTYPNSDSDFEQNSTATKEYLEAEQNYIKLSFYLAMEKHGVSKDTIDNDLR